MKLVSKTHVWIYRSSSGRFGGRLSDLSILLLTTRGRKTGRRRTLPLVYLRDAAGLVIVASSGGSVEDPNWLRNLRLNQDVTVQIGGLKQPMVALEAVGGEYERLWPKVITTWPGYAKYQARTRRQIPLVILTGDLVGA